jgi:prevent-host-death family protein
MLWPELPGVRNYTLQISLYYSYPIDYTGILFLEARNFVQIEQALTRVRLIDIVMNTTWRLSMRAVTASEANRNFSGLLREVAGGESVLVVSRGTPVATMNPVRVENHRQAGKNALLSRLERQKADGRRDWTRDELYRDTL